MDLLTPEDVLVVNTNVSVTITAGLLVVEAQGVQKLMLDHLVVHTPSSSQGYNLSSTSTPHIGPAPAHQHDHQ